MGRQPLKAALLALELIPVDSVPTHGELRLTDRVVLTLPFSCLLAAHASGASFTGGMRSWASAFIWS